MSAQHMKYVPGGTTVVDQLLGGLFGGQDDDDDEGRRRRATDFVDRYERGAPYDGPYDGVDDDEVMHNYRATVGRLSPQEFEEATAQSLGRLSREERRELRRRMRHQGGGQIDDDGDDPRLMAREISQYRQQGSDDPLGGLGGMLGGMFGSSGGSNQGGSSGGDLLGGPLGKAVMGESRRSL
jgi:hypothetical protein